MKKSLSTNPDVSGKGVRGYAVRADDAGIRLDRWFKRHHPGLPHALLARLARTGRLRVDGKRIKLGDPIQAGQVISLPILAGSQPVRPRSIFLCENEEKRLHDWVIYRDDAVLALNKPSGLATQGGSKMTRHLDGWLDALRFGAQERPRLVHRLDRDTSGVVLIGRTASAAAALAKAFRSRVARKLYWALTCRPPQPSSGRIDLSLKKCGQPGRQKMVAGQGGRRAVTMYRTVETISGCVAWLALEPLTGRTHQLRVHCAEQGFPIQGDQKYGDQSLFLRGSIAARLHLHARAIMLPHPDGGMLRIHAPLSGHMAASWQIFGFDPETAPGDFLDDFDPGSAKI